MRHLSLTKSWQFRHMVFITTCLLMGCLTTFSVTAQVDAEPTTSASEKDSWRAPDLALLPPDWWSQLNMGSTEVVNQRVTVFLGELEQRVDGLVGEELSTARNSLSQLGNGLELLALVRKSPPEQQFDPPLSKDTYFLDDLLIMRAAVRKLEVQATQVKLQSEQAESQIRLLEGRRDKLINEYNSGSPEAPARMLTGIKRIIARVEYELYSERVKRAKQTLKQIEAQDELLDEQLTFARAHLVITEDIKTDIQKSIVEAHENLAEKNQKLAALQQQLLDVLSVDNINQSLELLRKQQLTRASAEAELAKFEKLILATKEKWYQMRADELDSGFDLQAAMETSRRVTANAQQQADLWASISQQTLITPVYDSGLNTVKNFELAQSVARDTLAVIDQIRSTGDDLLFIQDIFTRELIADRSGLSNTGARLALIFGNTWDRLVDLGGFHLFNIGDTAVTPNGLVKMLFILGLAWGISWLIRYLLARGLRKKRTAQSPAFYTLGRLLHYIIVVAGSFAALGSIGIDFANFALIAGALSVGIGFGLQAIVSNFVSGLILLFEGTLRVGDYIELDSGLCGVVKEINTRATIVQTNDSVDVVVPNSELVTTKLTNWTLRETVARIRIPFGVAYGSDKELVRKLALEAAGEVDFALTNMPGREPQIRLTSFGDSALEFDALIWVSRQGVRRPLRIKASFLWALETLLRENDVEIPFPQRDIHLRSDFRGPGDEDPEPDLSKS